MFTATDYAEMLIKTEQEKNANEFELFFKQFLEFLKSKKQEKLLPEILNIITAKQKSNANKVSTTITVRDKESLKQLQSKIDQRSENFDLNSTEIIENPNIVGGFIIRSKHSLLDASYRTALLDLYARLKS